MDNISSDMKIGYICYRRNSIAKIEIIGSNDEDRLNIFSKDHACYMTKYARIISIHDIKKDSIITSSSYLYNINYYLSEDVALSKLSPNFKYCNIRYYDDGRIRASKSSNNRNENITTYFDRKGDIYLKIIRTFSFSKNTYYQLGNIIAITYKYKCNGIAEVSEIKFDQNGKIEFSKMLMLYNDYWYEIRYKNDKETMHIYNNIKLNIIKVMTISDNGDRKIYTDKEDCEIEFLLLNKVIIKPLWKEYGGDGTIILNESDVSRSKTISKIVDRKNRMRNKNNKDV